MTFVLFFEREEMKLVIFDLDGTLLNTINDLATSTNYALRKFGYPEHEPADYRYFVGNGITKLVERALPEWARHEEQITQVKAEFVAYYSVHKSDLTVPYPGISELLEKLQQQQIKLAVASNKFDQATGELVHHYFGDRLFSIVLGQREGIPVKPNPAIVNDILEQTGVSRDEVLYVGDSGVDMQTARNAGVKSVGVTWGFRSRQELEENGALFVADQPAEILKICGCH